MRVLELGAGHCRVLVQLRKLFPDIELEGINKSAERYNCEQTANFFKHFTKKQWEKQKRVPIHFMDLDPGKLDHFKDNSLDVVFSQYTIAYIVDKARLLEDIWRVLKPDGVALILFSELYIVGHYNSFGEVIDQLAKKYNIELKFIGNYWMLYMKKKKGIELRLPLKFDPTRSYRLPNYQYISFYEYLPS